MPAVVMAPIAGRCLRALVIARRAVADFVRHDGAIYAAAVAFHVLLSLFPLLIVVVAAIGLVARSPALGEALVRAIVAEFPAGAVRDQVQSIRSVPPTGSGLFGVAGLLVAAWTASGMFGALRRALNNAFDVPAARPFLHSRLLDLVSVAAIVALGFVSTALTAAVGLARALAGYLGLERVAALAWALVTIPLPLILSTLGFLLAYRLVPDHRLGVRDLWAGALLAGVGFELGKAAFGLYLAHFGRYKALYGALGGVAAFLVFVYLVAAITILGAEIAAEVARARQCPPSPDAQLPG